MEFGTSEHPRTVDVGDDGNSEVGNLGVEIEHIGIDPAASFGAIGGRTVEPDASGDGGEPIGDGGSVGSNSGDASGDDFERNLDGSVKRNADGSPRKKRGRKPGSGGSRGGGSTRSTKARPLHIDGVSAVLVSLHTMGAAMLKTPELELDPEEAKQLATAIAEVQKHYPMTISPEAMAWTNLVMAAGMVYGPRMWLVRNRQKEEKAQRARNVGPTSGPFDPNTPAPSSDMVVPQPMSAAGLPPFSTI